MDKDKVKLRKKSASKNVNKIYFIQFYTLKLTSITARKQIGLSNYQIEIKNINQKSEMRLK